MAPTPASSKNDTPRSAARILNSIALRQQFRAAGRVTSEDTGDRPRPAKKRRTGADDESTSRQGNAAAGPSGSSLKTSHSTSDAKGKGRARSGADDDAESAAKNSKSAKGKNGAVPAIMPHETLAAYNRRVEAALRPGVTKAMKDARSVVGEQEAEAARLKERRIAKAQGREVSPDITTSSKKAAVQAGKNRVIGEDGELFTFEDREVKTFAQASQTKRVNDVAQAPPSLPKLKVAAKKGIIAGKGKTERSPLNAGQKRLLDAERDRVIGLYREMKAKKEAERESGKAST